MIAVWLYYPIPPLLWRSMEEPQTFVVSRERWQQVTQRQVWYQVQM